MKALIPAAGYATRLYPLTKDCPKGLLEVAGKPIMEWIIEKIDEIKKVSTVYVVTNDKFYQNFVDWSREYASHIPVEILNDRTTSNETRLGCIGDIQYTIENAGIDDELIQINGDSLLEDSLVPLYNFYKEKAAPVLMLVDVKTKELACRFGVVDVGENDKITYFEEKPENPPSTLCSVSTYIYPRKTVKLFKTYLDEGNNPDQPGRFVQWLYRKEPVYGFVMKGQFYDIGSMDTLEEARKEWVKFK